MVRSVSLNRICINTRSECFAYVNSPAMPGHLYKLNKLANWGNHCWRSSSVFTANDGSTLTPGAGQVSQAPKIVSWFLIPLNDCKCQIILTPFFILSKTPFFILSKAWVVCVCTSDTSAAATTVNIAFSSMLCVCWAWKRFWADDGDDSDDDHGDHDDSWWLVVTGHDWSWLVTADTLWFWLLIQEQWHWWWCWYLWWWSWGCGWWQRW